MTTVNRAAAWMEEIAEELEGLLPGLRAMRAEVVAAGPAAAEHSGYSGPHEQLEASAVEGYGFNRVEGARRRLLAALHEPFDDFPNDD